MWQIQPRRLLNASSERESNTVHHHNPIAAYSTCEMVQAKRAASRTALADEDTSRPDGSGSASAQKPATAEDGDALIERLNNMPTADFQAQYIDLNPPDSIAITFKCSSDLTKDELDFCFNLISTTSKADYEPSSFGWHPRRKRREMLEEEMRYLLLRPTGSGQIEGFLSFMMTHDSSPSVPVLYIYEIHLDAKLRGKGYGVYLMELAESIAAKTGVEKVMLTCFLSNGKALAFYGKRGFEKDVSSPDDRRTRAKVVKVDYVIMSKPVAHVVSKEEEKGEEDTSAEMLGAVRTLASKLVTNGLRDGEDVARMRGWT